MSARYKSVERLMYKYPVNIMRMQETLIEYMRLRGENDVHAQQYDNEYHASEGTYTDPPSDYVNRLLELERKYKHYSDQTRFIKSARRELMNSSDEHAGKLLIVFEMVYLEHMSIYELAMNLKENVRTLYRRKHELVKLMMKAQQDDEARMNANECQ